MISVCIATYNGERFIKEQIDSILTQLDENDEIIISDDSSTDKTIEILQNLRESRIKIYKNTRSKGFVYNFENALIHSSGDYIFLSDQDDIWYENKIEEITGLLQKYNLVVHDAIVIDENEKIIHDSYFNIINSGRGFIKNIIKNSYLGCCMAFKKEVLSIAIPFPKNLIGHDIWIGFIAQHLDSVFFHKKILLKYRRHNNTVTPSSNHSSNSLLYKFKYRIEFIIQYYNVFHSLRKAEKKEK